MQFDVAGFVAELTRLVETNRTTEHSFRSALATLFDSIAPDVNCINEPDAIRTVGWPDFVLVRYNDTKAAIN